MKTPDITAAQVVAIVQAILGVAAAFALPISDAQSAALVALVGVVAAVLIPADAAIRRKRAEVFGGVLPPFEPGTPPADTPGAGLEPGPGE